MQTEQPEPSMDPRGGGETDSYILKKKKKWCQGTLEEVVGNTAIGPSSHPGIQNLTSITAT